MSEPTTLPTEADGDCFPVAWRIIVYPGPATPPGDLRLCHGLVVRPADGLHHAHAWIEATSTVDVPLHDGTGTKPVALTVAVDRSNGQDLVMPAELYRKIGKAYDVHRYTAEEAAIGALELGTYGPWTEAS